ncbi:MAG TPA: protein-L-isoaspartate(D-aspartate) O-methyltransferase [Candidatus Acidoferrales bacterium]|nr:protein-L-isoaspartate(D-aspartate) O-methyltransferase [Candidatus Acidoferrales bacterium]
MSEYGYERDRMIREQLVQRGIHDHRVLGAMRKVPRHLFVEPSMQNQAYDDCPLPIGQNQTISQPYMVALMAQSLELKGSEKVLEIGTGSGYEAAVLAELCAQVVSVERLEELAARARERLERLGYKNIVITVGDGTLGCETHAPYDDIVVSAASPCIPRPLLSQLKPDGRLVLPMGEEELQTLVRIRKKGESLEEDYLGECRFVKLIGAYGWQS